MNWKDLKINPEYEKVLPKLTSEEYKALKASIKTHGVLVPLFINSKGIILDGHNRYRISKELGFKPVLKTVIKDFESSSKEKTFVISINLQRRNLNDFQKAEMGMALLNIEKKKAKEKERNRKRGLGSKELRKTMDSYTTVSNKIGLARATFQRARKVIEEGPEKIKELCRNQALSIRPAFELTKAFEDVPEEKKKILTEKLENGEMNPKEILRAIASTKAVKAQLEGEEEKIREIAEELFKDKYYTTELDSKTAIWEIEEIAGDPHSLITKEFPIDKFSSFEEAQKWAVERNGVCLGKREKWLIEFDSIQDKKLIEEKKLGKEKKPME